MLYVSKWPLRATKGPQNSQILRDASWFLRRLKLDSVLQTCEEKPTDLSWMQGRHFASYEAFCVGRVEATLKKLET